MNWTSLSSFRRYSVMAGTPEKMLEHLLETQIGKMDESNNVQQQQQQLQQQQPTLMSSKWYSHLQHAGAHAGFCILRAALFRPCRSARVHALTSNGLQSSVYHFALDVRRLLPVTGSFLEDFVLTHVIFMPSNHLCPTLMAQYPFAKRQRTGIEAYVALDSQKTVRIKGD